MLEIHIIAVHSVMTLSMPFHLPHIMLCFTSQNKIVHTTLMLSAALLYCKLQHFLRPEEAMLKTYESLSLKQLSSVPRELLRM